MLFGNKEFREQFMKDVLEIAEKKNLKLIYGALIGSLPQGIQCYDSDYDSVFLFVREDFPNNIMDADKSTYEEVLYRYYPSDPLSVWDSITYREFTSFLGFLKKPSIQKENRDYGLYYYFAEVLMSPYTWDPYGIQMKLLPIIQRCYNHDFMIRAFINRVKLLEGEGYSNINKVGIYNYKFYIRKVLYTFFLEWSLNQYTFSPTYMDVVLATSEDRQAVMEFKKILEEYRHLDIEICNTKKLTVIKEAHLSLEIEENIILEKYVQRIKERAERWLSNHAMEPSKDKDIQKEIKLMVEIVNNTMNEERVKGVS